MLIGHYASSALTGTEAVMNRLVGWTMDYSLQRGLYPLAPGSHMVFLNRHVAQHGDALVPRPSAVIVAGLGAEGSLQAADLIQTVRLAVIGWARRFSEEPGAARTFELASTLIGSGGSGISAGHAADLIVQGILEANELIARERSDAKARLEWPRCSHLRLIELYLDRAADAWRALQLRLMVKPNTFVLTETVQTGQGGHKRPPDSGYRGAPYDFITVDTHTNQGGARTFEFTLDSRRARSEVRGKTAQTKLLGELVATASSDQNRDHRIGRTLSNLLVPIELEGYLAGTSGIQMALDPESAAIPWELLDLARNEDPNEEPWAIRVKLLRKLKIDEFRQHVIDADKDANVLVIGEPDCSDDFPRLEGARTEAICVADTLSKSGDLGPRLTRLVADTPLAQRPDAHAIVNALFEKDWRIVHIAGHGMPGEGASPGGVVLSNGTFLGPDEIKSMRVVPELVFVNCCYLGQLGDTRRSRIYDRARFASGVAGALIDIGVRCVIAAGWAVDDAAATDFASTFYDGILRGDRFIDAVGHARRLAWSQHRDVNTWAAYQCYGDPDWRFQPKAPDANQVRSDDREFAGVATDVALDLELERIYVETKFQGADRATQVGKLQKLEQRFAPIWGRKGRIAEAFGRAYAEAGAMDRAKSWYERAKNAPDGSASISAAEQLGNVESRSGWELVERAVRERDQMLAQLDNLATKKPAATRAARAAARDALKEAHRRLTDATRSAGALIKNSLDGLRALQAIRPTMERQSLIASAIKRRVLVDTVAGRAGQARRGLMAMRKIYAEAVRIGQREKGADLHYPASNCLAADLVLGSASKRITLDKQLVAITDANVEARSGSNADFWSVVSGIELDEYRAIAARRLAGASGGLKRRYQDLYARKTSARMWASVYDNAYLVLNGYARKSSPKEQRAATDLLNLLRSYAHPGE